MRAEVVVLGDPAPVRVDHAGTLFPRAYAIHPVVFVRETPAGPTQVGDVDRFEGFDDVGANAPDVGDRRVFADPNAVINAAAQVFGEVTINVTINFCASKVGIEYNAGHGDSPVEM